MLVYLDTIVAFVVVMLGFSLLITLFNQIVSAILGLRGTNLLNGIETMLKTLDPELKDHAKAIGAKILTNPTVSDSIFANFRKEQGIVGRLIHRYKLANAIGPDALIRTMREIADDKDFNEDTRKKIGKLITEIDPEVQRKLENITAAFNLLQPEPGFAVQVDDYLTRLGNSAQQSVGKVEAWFNVSMKRVSQRFAMQMRISTVICAFVLAFGIHLDTFTLANRLLGSPELRAQAIAQSSAMLAEAQAILGDQASAKPFSATAPQSSSPEVLKSAMQQLIKNNINKDAEAQPGKLDSVPEFKTPAEAEKWLNDNLNPNVTPQRRQQLAGIYGQLVVSGLQQKAKDVAGILQKTGLDLVPGERSWNTFKASPIKFFFGFDGMRNFIGVLLTAGLLALGAPFWYNALKTLTSLRSQVSIKSEEQKKDAAS